MLSDSRFVSGVRGVFGVVLMFSLVSLHTVFVGYLFYGVGERYASERLERRAVDFGYGRYIGQDGVMRFYWERPKFLKGEHSDVVSEDE